MAGAAYPNFYARFIRNVMLDERLGRGLAAYFTPIGVKRDTPPFCCVRIRYDRFRLFGFHGLLEKR